ncbi:MAG: ABC transporter substrate-binding protein [Lachnospiraceae bacterium]|jgi:multiple sugar transport system substrate-binding protein|nr:ABC transporter substrate-binding protein [Lachnospiraceae bacterium]MCI9097505.1 ABC transporter substrate-binding protein [Lachnospiraceae bacterium]MCI9202411.1 ABC transporter substrate-binding protein [Lachnospiraceae bacterium]
MKRKLLAGLLVAALSVAALTGCGGNAGEASKGSGSDTGGTSSGEVKENDSAEGAQAADESVAGSGDVIELTMWGSWGGDQVGQLEKQLENFNTSQSQYHVTYAVQDSMEQKLLTAIASNEVPDIVLWDRFNTGVYAPKGALASLDDYIAKDNIDMSQFYAPAVDELTSGGVVYGIPLTVDSRILFYNKDMLEEAGVDPASITDWDSLREAAIKLTKWDGDMLVQSGFSLKDVGLFNNWIGQAGGKMIDDSTNPPTVAFNTEAGLKVLEYWNQLLNEDKVYQLGFEDGFGGDGFKAGKVAITFNGPWTLESYKEAGLNFGVIEQPEGYNGEKSAMMGGFGLIIPNGAKNADAAWEFIKWWTMQPENGVEFCKISGNLPANVNAAKDPYFMDDEILKVFSETMEYAGIRSKVFGYSDLEGLALIPQLQKYVAGEITAQEALDNAEKQGNQILSDAAQQ